MSLESGEAAQKNRNTILTREANKLHKHLEGAT